MSDLLTSPQAPAPAPAPAQESSNAGQPAVPASPQPQTPIPAEQTPKPVNLYDLPEFREYQSQRDRTEAQRQREYQQQMAQMQRQMQEQMDRLAMQNMPDEERGQYLTQRQLQQLQQERDAYAQQLQALQTEQARLQVLSEIAGLTGAPLTELVKASGPDEAWKLGITYTRNQAQAAQQQAQQQQRSAANLPDIGGGAPSTPVSDLKRQYEQARADYDGAAMTRIRLQAQREGIQL